MNANMVIHPKSVFQHYLSAPVVENLDQIELEN